MNMGGDVQVVGARLDRLCSERGSEELDVRSFVRSDLLEAAADPLGQSGVDEVLLGVFIEALGVEGTLEIFKGECEVEDFDV